MNIAAYCRVSTDKSDQLNSLEAQKKFFMEYTEKNGHNLVRLYADEGISGTFKRGLFYVAAFKTDAADRRLRRRRISESDRRTSS